MINAFALSAALLLVVAGAAKLRSPGPAVAMLVAGTRLGRHGRVIEVLVRSAALAEIAVGVAVFAVGGPSAMVLLAAVYVMFIAVAGRAVRQGATPCGCFGRDDSPIVLSHVVLNVCCALAAAGAALHSPGPFGGLGERSPLAMTIELVQVLLLAALGLLAITTLPALAAARRQLEVS